MVRKYQVKGLVVPLVLGGLASMEASAQWATFVNETASRVNAANNMFASDPEEKDFAFGDLDQDGDIDLVVARKGPFTTNIPKPNVLLMNEGVKEGQAFNGVLVDRTQEFATAADNGGQGFKDATNDRNIAMGDVNGDGWLDVVTAPALAPANAPKAISHPRVYINLGDDENGNWLGLKFELARTPQLSPIPNACGLGLGDVTGDGLAEIYIADYFNSAGDKLLINNGSGFFTDETLARMTSGMASSGFGTAAAIVDINNDGKNDLVKSENGPFKTTYNNPANQGFFNKQTTPSSGAHYNMSVAELNNDGKFDIIISDDGSDRYLLNDGTNADGSTKFISKTYSFQGGGDDGIAGNSASADLNNDGWNDVIIADVDVDIPGCSRRAHIYRNLGNAPVVTLQEQGAVIPNSNLVGTHDIAIFDLNGDGWKDIIVGRCSGSAIWMNVPPVGLAFTYPNGIPGFVSPGVATSFTLHLEVLGEAEVVESTVKITQSINGGASVDVPGIALGGGDFQFTLPALNCTEVVSYFISAQLTNNSTFRDPPSAPAQTYSTIAAVGTELTLRDEFEKGSAGWSVTNGPGIGQWMVADPLGTVTAGKVANPDDDATSTIGAVNAFVTDNGVVDAVASAYDVDLGPHILTSPAFDLADTDGVVTFAAWLFCDNASNPTFADVLKVEVSNDNGRNWTQALQISDTSSTWKNHSFLVGDVVAPTANVKVRFSVADAPNNSITEAGIDNFQVEAYLCGSSCTGDLDGSGEVDGADLGSLLAAWGTADEAADLDASGEVDGADLGALLAAWGACS
jgi:hypothetical protein